MMKKTTQDRVIQTMIEYCKKSFIHTEATKRSIQKCFAFYRTKITSFNKLVTIAKEDKIFICSIPFLIMKYHIGLYSSLFFLMHDLGDTFCSIIPLLLLCGHVFHYVLRDRKLTVFRIFVF